jgi:hypothetical protein
VELTAAQFVPVIRAYGNISSDIPFNTLVGNLLSEVYEQDRTERRSRLDDDVCVLASYHIFEI